MFRMSVAQMDEGGGTSGVYGYGPGAVLWLCSIFTLWIATGQKMVEWAIADEADARPGRIFRTVGVVANNPVGIEPARIDGARQSGTDSQLTGIAKRVKLERHGDIGAACAFKPELFYRLMKAIQWREQPFIGQILAGLAGKHGVDFR